MAEKTVIAQLSLSTLPPLHWDTVSGTSLLPDWRIDAENFRETEYDLFGKLFGIVPGRRIEIGIFTDQDLVFGEQYDENAVPKGSDPHVDDPGGIARYLGYTFTSHSGATVVRGLTYGKRELDDNLPDEQRIGVLARDAVPLHPELRRQALAALPIIITRPLKIRQPIYGLVGFERANQIVETIQPEAVGGQGPKRWSIVGSEPHLQIDPNTGEITVSPDAFNDGPQINVKIQVRTEDEEDEAVFPIIRKTETIEARTPSVTPRYTRPPFNNVLVIPISDLFNNVHFASANARFDPPRLSHSRHKLFSGLDHGSLLIYLPERLSVPVLSMEITIGDATGHSARKTIEIVD